MAARARHAIVAAALALAIGALAAPSARALKPGKLLEASPPGQLMTVSANLKASFNNKYIRDSGPRMRTFVSRLLAQIHERGGLWRPDVLLLQEALNRQRAPGRGPADDLSAARVASELTNLTGDEYAIVVDPGKRQRPSRGVSKETAIVANVETMNWPAAGGYVISNAFKDKREFKYTGPNRPTRPPSRRQAWAVIAERDPQGATFPVASVHYLTDKRLGCTRGARCQRRVNSLKERWSRQVSDRLKAWSGDYFERAVIGGDFNATRKDGFYGALADLGYRKAIRGRIDHIFTRGAIGPTGIDDSRHSGRGAYPLGYSDHRFLWATLG
jgi:endonuclease/exonuclease/phosphatase family metal-dependent hydrolase